MTVGEFSYGKVSCIWAFLSVSLVVNNVQKCLGYFYFITHDEKLSVHTVVNITTNIQLVENAIASLGSSGLFAAGTVICWCQRTHTWSCAWLVLFHYSSWTLNRMNLPGLKYLREKEDMILSFFLWLLLYSAILRSRADALRSHAILNELLAFYSTFLNLHRSSVLAALCGCYVAGATSVKLLSSRRVLRTPYNHAPFHVTSCKATYAGCMRVYL